MAGLLSWGAGLSLDRHGVIPTGYPLMCIDFDLVSPGFLLGK
ncbi:MAG TPA: hypothetical protein VHH32_12310 [Gemmatimonadales bacterium]|nr:hypothetical protein [Gemmatimonadales bacterium]